MTRKTPEGIYLREFCGAGGGGRTRTVSLPTDFESVTSANSITPAHLLPFYYTLIYLKCKNFIPKNKREFAHPQKFRPQ